MIGSHRFIKRTISPQTPWIAQSFLTLCSVVILCSIYTALLNDSNIKKKPEMLEKYKELLNTFHLAWKRNRHQNWSTTLQTYNLE